MLFVNHCFVFISSYNFFLIYYFILKTNNLMLRYIPKENEINLKNFKYQGGTSSLTYEYIWSPLAEFLLKFTPEWIAPNLITFLAFLIVLISHFIFMFVGQDQFAKPAPAWKCIMMCLTIFIYQQLDNMDGKQARRTSKIYVMIENSTPVGMLFDHGADAITAVLFGIQLLVLFGIRSEDVSILMLVYFVLYPNFAGIWNQYSIGHFKLDRINPIDEGLPAYSLFALMGAFFNYYQFFNSYHWYANWNYEIVAVIAIGIFVAIGKLHRDLIVNPLIRHKSDITTKILLPLILVSSLLIWKFVINSNIYINNFYPIVYILTFMWSRNMMLMQVCYVTKIRFHSLNIGTLTFIVIWIGTNLLYYYNFNIQFIHTYLVVSAFIQLFVLLEFIFSFLEQAKQILDIKIFSIKSKQDKIS